MIDQNDPQFIRDVLSRYQKARDAQNDWRKEAKAAYNWRAGHQWDDEVLAKLTARKQPAVTFNRIDVFISAITGLETLNRQEVRIIPRKTGPEAQYQADLWTAAIEYVNDDNFAEHHHAHAFSDLVTCGIGATLTRMDYERNPDGDIAIDALDPLRLCWDHKARSRNLQDARWIGYIERMRYDEAKRKWGDAAENIRGGGLFDLDSPTQPHDATAAPFYTSNSDLTAPDDADEISVLRYQWYEIEPYYRASINGQEMQWSPAEYKQIKKQIPEIETQAKIVRQQRRKYYEAFIAGMTVLEITPLSCDDFTIRVMTGKVDANKGAWYGAVRSMIDPQKWVNKMYSQIMHVINSNSKGGLLAERSAFDDPNEAEERWAQPDKIVFTKDGAVQRGAIQQKEPMSYPQGMDRLMTLANEMFTQVSGASIELLGLAEKVQPGVLEQQRKQAGMTILSWAFDALTHYRRQHGRVLARYIQEYIADGRLIRLTKTPQQEYVPLVRDALAVEYDVIADESPMSPNEKDRTFAVLMQLMPTFMQMGIPIPPSFMDYLPLPSSLTEEWKQAMQGDPQKQQMAQLMTQMQALMAQLEAKQKEADIRNTEADTTLKQANAQKAAVEAQVTPIKVLT